LRLVKYKSQVYFVLFPLLIYKNPETAKISKQIKPIAKASLKTVNLAVIEEAFVKIP
tara:strand:+ start:1075 stop:1245 length:171 start_codon:yes stop_codon:yes gene_type:complete